MALAQNYFRCLALCCILLFSGLSAAAQMFIGIGMTFQQDTLGGIAYPKIQSFIPDGPAQKSGLQVGMYIYAVNGTSCRGLPIEAVFRLIKGDEGESLTIMADKDKTSPSPKMFILKRAIITRESGDVLGDFYSTCDMATQSLKNQGFEIVKTFKGACDTKELNFTVQPNKTYYTKVYLLEIFNFAGISSCWLSATLDPSKNTDSSLHLQRAEVLTVKGIDINALYGSATFKQKQMVSLKLQSHPRESPTILRESYTVIYAK